MQQIVKGIVIDLAGLHDETLNLVLQHVVRYVVACY